jgi:methionyl-tRNA formyltransferase
MEDLNLRRLDEQIALVQERFLQQANERARWEEERRRIEERLRALEAEMAALREAEKRLLLLESENERYRKSQEAARQQVGRVLERIRSIER